MDMKRWYHFLTIKILVSLCTYGAVLSEITCTPGLKMPGYTVPQGDIVIEEGSDLDIMCVVINDTHNNASLSFQRNSEPIPSENIKVINSTSIKLHYPNPPLASGDTYTCLLNNETSVCMNRVIVGKKPQQVTDFACIAYNFDNLTCTWTAPENYVRTEYSLVFTLGGGRSSRFPSPCPRNNITDINRNMSCFWNISTTPPYRQVHEIFNFTLTMHNEFGTNQFNEIFHHFAHVLSGPPENLTEISKTPSSIYLYWVVPLSMQTFPSGVHHRILYQCEYGEKKWNDGGLLTVGAPKKYAYYNLTNIPYAHALCDIRVSLRSAKALPDDESMWSRNASLTVRTSSKIPDEAPQTNVGSFELLSQGSDMESLETYIYWKQIPEVRKNGPDFAYKIRLEGNDSVRPVELTNTYAKFQNLSNAHSYRFRIWSTNANGSSIDSSSVYIPKQSERVKEPSSFTKVELSEGEYELAWEPPKLKPNEVITNFTIFTCSNERERPYQCNGMLNWTIIPSDKTAINMTVDKNKVYQFAISTNTRDGSSGMLWAACTVIRNKSVGKIKNIWVNTIAATYMELSWKLDCTDNIGSVENFIVYYCPIKSPLNQGCKGPQFNTTFPGNANGGKITNLTAYTTYMMTVAAKTKHNTYSQQSDPLLNTTLESTPSEPQNLTIANVTNSSVVFAWDEPLFKNGLMRFRVGIKGDDLIVEKEVGHQRNYTWENLTSHEKYVIWVKACTTVNCSNAAEINVVTLMGYPNRISKPTVDRRNDTTITITWNKPSKPAGNLDYYSVRFKQKHTHENLTFEINTTDLKYVIKHCGEGGKFNAFYISVRAINIINGTEYPSEWSDELENYCDTPFNYILYISLAAVVVVGISLCFASNRLYHRCKIMRDVEVKLPPGLAPVVADQTLVPWSTEKHQNNHDSHAPPDEELLLVKMNEGRHFSGDSSGCSSGHESVTSSLGSGTHISSSSDSGTEQPVDYLALAIDPKLDACIEVAADADDVYQPCEDANEPTPYVLGGEAVKRVNPGYVAYNPTADAMAKSSGYVVAGIKNVNGYIPFGQTEAVSKNTGYVVAGIKNCKLD